MVLATLILLSLTAVGVMSVQHTNTDLMSSGNLAQASKAAMAADVGMNQSRALLGDQATCYTWIINKMKTEHYKGNTAAMLEDCSGEDKHATENESLLLIERTTVSPVADYHLSTVMGGVPIARLQQDMAYDGEIYFIKEIDGIPGWQVEGSGAGGSALCFQIYDIRSRGGIPTQGETTAQTLCPTSTDKPCFTDDDCDLGSTCQNDHCFCQPRKVVVPGLGRVVAGPTPCYLK
jgi:hypothetical protein